MMCPLLACFHPTGTPGSPPAAGPDSTGRRAGFRRPRGRYRRPPGRRREAGRNATVNP